MEREPSWIVITLMLKVCVWLVALLPLHISYANSELDKPVGREIAIDKNPGFISIDCGSSIAYLDNNTGIWYQTDEGFVETGTNQVISSTANLNYRYFGKRFSTLRYFKEGDRNCYILKPEQGKNNRYLIRAFFAYGNYDGKNQTSSFELHLGVNLWEKVNVSLVGYQFAEIIHTPTTDSIDVCLVKTGPTIPFISTLELRLLNSSIYQNQIMSSNSGPQPLLYLQVRVDVGSPRSPDNNYFFRYKDDVYDRMWRYDPYYNYSGWHLLDLPESFNINPGANDDVHKLPAQVLRSAAQSLNVSSRLEFYYDNTFAPLDRPYEYLVYFHFAEIEKLPHGQKRRINITLFNSETSLSQPLVLEYLKPVSLVFKTQGYVWFNVSATSLSDAPPILNAFEIYKLITQCDSPTYAQDVGAILEIKNAYQISKLSWQGDPCLPKQYAWEGLVCSSHTNPRITSLNLSSSKLTGKINTSFSYLTELEFLDLSHNELEGAVPEFLANLPKLKVLNLTGKKLSGSIPKALKEKAEATLQLSVADNPDLYRGALTVTDNPDLCTKDSCIKKNVVIPLVASLSALIAILLISLGLLIFRRQKVADFDLNKRGSLKSKHQAFSFTDILDITDNFKIVIGEGGFGKVYFGMLQDDTQVAIKLLSPSSMQGYKEFRSEAQLLMNVHHRNLVSLFGYCDEGEIKALIYEYMANGNLQQHLSEENPIVLKWNERLNIAVDAAQGIDYLHNGCKPPLVHRDLKTSNILLDHNMHAKIADFGLCRAFCNDIDSHISTRPAGTPGYVDPEFQRTGNSNKKSDIYSFGIILFELITGQQALARAPGKSIHILEWVLPIVERGDILNVIDPRLQEEFSINSAWKIVEIGMSCTSPTAAERPDMSQILVELKECLSLDMVQRIGGRTTTLDGLTSLQIEPDIGPVAR